MKSTHYPKHLHNTHFILSIQERERGAQPIPKEELEVVNGCAILPSKSKPVSRTSKRERAILDGWKKDPRMVFLANPGRDLTAKERKEWERNITQYQL